MLSIMKKAEELVSVEEVRENLREIWNEINFIRQRIQSIYSKNINLIREK